ncbi:hypothetical protein CSA56_02195 [candidate division KSB3 bacterium]|uniref:PAS domain S-box protein n=1 Tax=candidate division KSB3 bacterium TaxID=2044937 RepID=A0A2G6KKH3_9BACT|nr:MAG: hypothetical protein CSA56_02195 [candidate division KSB3 bacterium]
MLTRRKKTRPWLKGKTEGLKLLTQLTQIFDEHTSLEDISRKIGECIALYVHTIGHGIYLYDQEQQHFSCHISDENSVFRQYPVLTHNDLEQCGIQPLNLGIISISPSQSELPAQHAFLHTCAQSAIMSVNYVPLIARGEPYGIFLFASKSPHHLDEESISTFSIVMQHMRLATEKILLSEQFENEISAKISQIQGAEEKYREIFEKASDAIVCVDFETQRFLESNRQAETILGHTKHELSTMTVSDFWTASDEKRLVRSLLQRVKTHRALTLQDRQIRRKDGSFLWVEITASVVTYQGKDAALASIRDVSQRKQIEAEKGIVEAVNKALISSHDQPNVYDTFSQTLQQFFSFDRMDLFLPGNEENTARRLVSVQRGKKGTKPDDVEFPLEGLPIEHIFRKGTPRIVYHDEDDKSFQGLSRILGRQFKTSLFFPLVFKQKVTGVLHFGSKQSRGFSPKYFGFLEQLAPQVAITLDNMLLFRAVNEERAVYKHLIENVNEIVFQADPKGTILFVNHRVKNILGYTPEEITGTNFFACVIPEDLEEAKAAFRLTLRHEQPLSGEYRVFHKNGTMLTISIYTRPIFEEGRTVGMQAIIQDMTPASEHFTVPRDGLHELIGRSHKMQEIYDLIMSVAKTDSTVLIHGESGTGKELIAQAVHASSHRHHKPFIVMNCAAYSEHLLESELFGHERGAFTGAHRRKLGRFELAKGGTIFLDEIGEIPHHSQLLLLRVLQNKTFERVGGEKTLETDVRIVSATNKNLEEEMKAGRFREDLYYRLNVIPIEVPPLRERKEDIPHLVDHFRKKYSINTGKQVVNCAQSTLELLMRYDWYGNVRELENTIERAVVMASGPVLTPNDLPAKLQQEQTVPVEKTHPNVSSTSLYEHERQLILQALQTTNWNKYQTAKMLGINRSTLYSKIQKYGIDSDHSKN